MSTPFLVLYRDRLSLGPSATVGIFVVYVGGILSALALVGPLSDRWGRRAIVLPTTVISALASLVLIAGRDSYPLLLAGRLMLGVASGAVLAIGAAWLQELMGKGEEMRAALLATIIGFLGFGIGPVVSAIFEAFDAAPLIAPFLFHVALVVAALIGIWPTRETIIAPNPAPPFRLRFGIPDQARSEFLRIVVPAALWVFAFPSTAFALFPVLVSDSVPGFEVAVAATSGLITSWSAMMSRPVLARIAPRKAMPVAMWVGVAGYLLGTGAFAFGWWPLVLPAAFFLGAASGVLASGSLTLVGEMADDDQRGSLTGTFYLTAYPAMSMPLIITALGAVMGSISGALLVVTVVGSGAAVLVTRSSRT